MRIFHSLALALVAALALSTLAPTPAQARKLKIKMGTVAPQGSIWHKALLEMAEVFSEETGGKVELKVYAGVVGDEPTIVRKMRVGQLHAATLTNTGLALITTEPMAVQLPMMFDSYEEMDAVMAGMAPTFDKALEEDGFVTLTWSDGGWIHFFTREPAVSVADVQGVKSWMWAHDAKALEALAAVGFAPVVLSGVDIIPSLQTGMIDALPTTPITAVALQTYPHTQNMIGVRWSMMVGGTIISKEAWERVPAEARPRIRARCMEVGKRLSTAVRAETDSAIAIMTSKGLKVHTPTAAQLVEWRARADKVNAIVRQGSVDPALADKAFALRDAYRKQHGKK